MAIDTLSKAYTDMEADRTLTDALWGDTPAMRAAGEAYLPARSGEKDDGGSLNKNYETRLNETTLSNYFKPAINGLSGKVFQKPIQIEEALRSKDDWWNDFDLSDTNINDFALNVFEAGVRHGVSFVLVDAPVEGESSNLAEQKKKNIRPYCTHITADQVIGWRSERINNAEVLTDVRIKESVIEEDDDYNQESIAQIRQITLDESSVIWRVWRKLDKGEWFVYAEGFYSLGYIPLFPFYTGRTGFFEAKTYFTTLAYLNVLHWQSSSYQRNILNVARVPRFGAYGLTEEEAEALNKHGVKNGIFSTNPANEVRVEWVEADGQSIAHGERDLEKLEEQMALRSLDPILKKAPNTEVATIANIESSKANSILQSWAESLQRTLRKAVSAMLEMAGEPNDDPEILVNDEYSVVSNMAERVKELREMRAMGEISHATFLYEVKRIGFFDDDFDIEGEVEAVNDELNLGESERNAA